MKKVCYFLFSFFLLSCGPAKEDFQKMSAGQIGCPWPEVQVSEIHGHKWVATCREDVYDCYKAGPSPSCTLRQEED